MILADTLRKHFVDGDDGGERMTRSVSVKSRYDDATSTALIVICGFETKLNQKNNQLGDPSKDESGCVVLHCQSLQHPSVNTWEDDPVVGRNLSSLEDDITPWMIDWNSTG
uniref:Uncharacterized protein n=1 Tax=Setaria digitata TaxID=48799 RepID=A0A915PFA1_9BILA